MLSFGFAYDSTEFISRSSETLPVLLSIGFLGFGVALVFHSSHVGDLLVEPGFG